MQANRGWLKAWEKFQVYVATVNDKQYMTLKSNAFNTWVTVGSNGDLNCNAAVPTMAEEFTGWEAGDE